MVKTVDTQIAPQLAAIHARILTNQDKVLTSFQKHTVAQSYLTGSTGYGHNEQGRHVLTQIYADVLGGTHALVRPQLVSGTTALGVALLGLVRPGHEILYITGKP